MIQTARLIGPDQTLKVEPLGFALEVSVKFLRAKIGAAASRIILWALVGTHENMSLKRWHRGDRHTGIVKVLSLSISTVTSRLLRN